MTRVPHETAFLSTVKDRAVPLKRRGIVESVSKMIHHRPPRITVKAPSDFAAGSLYKIPTSNDEKARGSVLLERAHAIHGITWKAMLD